MLDGPGIDCGVGVNRPEARSAAVAPCTRPAPEQTWSTIDTGADRMTNQSALQFGIYPLSVAGTPKGLAVGPPDKYDQIRAVLDDLGHSVQPRTYLVDVEPGGESQSSIVADRYRQAGLLRHVVLGCLRDTGFELDRWLDLVRTVVRRHGDVLSSLQISDK